MEWLTDNNSEWNFIEKKKGRKNEGKEEEYGYIHLVLRQQLEVTAYFHQKQKQQQTVLFYLNTTHNRTQPTEHEKQAVQGQRVAAFTHSLQRSRS